LSYGSYTGRIASSPEGYLNEKRLVAEPRFLRYWFSRDFRYFLNLHFHLDLLFVVHSDL
jgi:hypothetical protein